MARRPALAPAQNDTVRTLDRGFWLVVALAVVLIVAMVARVVSDAGGGSAATSPSAAAAASGAGATASSSGSATPADIASYLLATPREAPPLELTDQDDRPASLATFRGGPVFVFFGYTHCPDVCPATIGTVGLVMDAYGPGVRALFVTIDPARDTTTWLREYVRFLPEGFTTLTGSDDEIRTTADAWGVQYARVETTDPNAYAMAHTADVFLVDATGMLRAKFAFGTEPEPITAVLREVVATTPVPAGSPVASAPSTATPIPAGCPRCAAPTSSGEVAQDTVGVVVVSSSVWAGPTGPIILSLSIDGAPLDDPNLRPIVQLTGLAGGAIGAATAATPVRPPGVDAVSYVADLAIPSPGLWRLRVTADRAGTSLTGTTTVTALDPGGTAPLGGPAPRIATPTLDDVGGIARAVTTDPAPDLRLSRRSTADALAEGQPFVLVVDSTRFQVSQACGRAIIMARYLLDRWRDVGFIHLEPFRYSVVASTPVLDGSLDDPTLTEPAAAWGFGEDPWGAQSMPWVFVVDGDGIVRAKYQGVMGTADIDVMVALIEQGD
ncbi:MAG: SCO family protein [Chloroflexota bacterium]